MTTKYKQILATSYDRSFPHIKYAFGREQYDKVIAFFASEGIAKDQLRIDSTGAIGTDAAFAERNTYYESISDRIIAECTPDEIYSYEWNNHECGYTGEDTEALAIVRDYFPNYTPGKALLKKLNKSYADWN